MERIRKALDLAREERARLVVIAERSASSEPLAETRSVTVAAINPAVEAKVVRQERSRPVAAAAKPVPAFEAAADPGESASTVAAAEPTPPGSETKTAANLLTKIEYSTTRTFSPAGALLESNRIVDVSRPSPAGAAFRMLRTQVLQRMEEHGWRSLAVLSPGSHDGKTTTAINLAVSLANDHRHTVLLIEFDLKRPTIAGKLGIVPEMGADDLLRGDARVEDCLYHPEGFDRLVVLPARAAMDNSSETLAGRHCRQLVAQLRDRYADRLLVFDLPPVLGSDDALAFAPLVDCALVVVAEGATRRDDLLRCMELLRRTPIVGTVLNRSTDAASGYG